MIPSTTRNEFQRHGVEIEYVLVDDETLDVRPIAGEVLADAAGHPTEDWDGGPIGWSNELVAHQIELKNVDPETTLAALAPAFHASVQELRALATRRGATLLPTGMHPWMVPRREARLWSGPSGPIYRAYDRLFDCRRHGWANMQATHLNLPFGDADEFARLLAAIRVVLPILPAIAASSPVVEGRVTGLLDNRLDFYRTNALDVPAMTGATIPEPIFDEPAYRRDVLGWIDSQLADVEGGEILLGHEWTNARGAIARFDRSAIEVRVMDTQECPRADLALCAAACAALTRLLQERGAPHAELAAYPTAALARLLAATGNLGLAAPVEEPRYAALFGLDPQRATDVGALWRLVLEGAPALPSPFASVLELVLERGPLAARLLAALGSDPTRADLTAVYRDLTTCLAGDELYVP